MASKVLYLDFDGVLHPDGTEAIDDRGRLIANPALFSWLPVLVELLKPFPEVRIIVSSDWRRLFDDAALIRLLGPLGNRFAGVVERIAPPRAQEILHDAQTRGLSDWIALDDHRSVHQAARMDPRFIACEPVLGVTSDQVQLAVRMWLARG
ncbi:HAD domain-containing protein [Dechloromonas hortensis]|uniref:HAD domain-containing protein n=1 Tax=Dechloromonas hortensis TaxID=337779 RepID=UPI001478E909|nr:HAD domain-containing protein [Dechloromonas hortensis]